MYLYKGIITRVVDGDTFIADVDVGFNISITERFRLAEADTPETHRPSCEAEKQHGLEATKFVKDLIEGKEVYLATMKSKGKYGRYVAHIYLNEQDASSATNSLTQMLVENDLMKRDNYS